MKCGSHDAPNRRNQQFVWTPPWVYVFFRISPIIGAIIAVIVQKKGRAPPAALVAQSRWKNGMACSPSRSAPDRLRASAGSRSATTYRSSACR